MWTRPGAAKFLVWCPPNWLSSREVPFVDLIVLGRTFTPLRVVARLVSGGFVL